MTRQGVALVAALTLAALPAAASPKDTGMATVRGLSNFCAANPNTENFASCSRFLTGVVALEAAEHKNIDQRMAFCPPINDQHELAAGIARMLVALNNMAHSTPKLQDAPAIIGTIAAGRIAFPCHGDIGRWTRRYTRTRSSTSA